MIKLSDGIVARALGTDRGRTQIRRSIVESETNNSSAATLASLWIHILEPSEICAAFLRVPCHYFHSHAAFTQQKKKKTP